MKNILVTGANGQLGNEMRVLSLENKEYNYFFTDVAELDICDEKAVMAFVKENEIDVIVNCAAYTAVDKAEDNQELCAKLNSEAVGYLAKAAEENQAEFLQITYLTEPIMYHIEKPNRLVLILYMVLLNWPVKKRLWNIAVRQ